MCDQFLTIFTGIDHDGIASPQLVSQDDLRSQCLHILLQIPFQRSCAVHRVIAVVYHVFLRLIGQFYLDLTLLQTLVGVCNHQIYDVGDVVLGQRLEHDDLVQTVQEFWSEMTS